MKNIYFWMFMLVIRKRQKVSCCNVKTVFFVVPEFGVVLWYEVHMYVRMKLYMIESKGF
jgi:hypothetical protein